MRTRLVSGLIFIGFVALGASLGCTADVGPLAEGEQRVSATPIAGTGGFVTVRRDMRRCMAPLCGGFFLKPVNREGSERYVFDLTTSGLDPETRADIEEGPLQDLLLRGQFGDRDPRFHVASFYVTEAYRGLPGVAPADTDWFYRTTPREPPIACFAAPCDNLIAVALNTTTDGQTFTRLSVERALKPAVDGSWVEDRILRHGALVTGVLRDGDRYPAGYERVLDVSQVYLRLPETMALCPIRPHVVCGGSLRETFTRGVDRCLAFDGCASLDECRRFPVKCEEGYVRQTWPADNARCFDYACDPEFTR